MVSAYNSGRSRDSLYFWKAFACFPSHVLNCERPSFKKICRREKSSWSLTATTASSLNNGSKSKTFGSLRAVAMASTAAVLPVSEVGAKDRT